MNKNGNQKNFYPFYYGIKSLGSLFASPKPFPCSSRQPSPPSNHDSFHHPLLLPLSPSCLLQKFIPQPWSLTSKIVYRFNLMMKALTSILGALYSNFIVVLILLTITLFPVTTLKHPLPIPNDNDLTISFGLGFMPLLVLISLKVLFILMIMPKMHGIAFSKIFKITKPLAFCISKSNSMISNFVTFPMSKPIAPNSIILPLLSTISAHPLPIGYATSSWPFQRLLSFLFPLFSESK